MVPHAGANAGAAAGACSAPAAPGAPAVGPAMLFFGCRRSDQDFLYGDMLRGWHEAGHLELHTAFSRQQVRDSPPPHGVAHPCAPPTTLPVPAPSQQRRSAQLHSCLLVRHASQACRYNFLELIILGFTSFAIR